MSPLSRTPNGAIRCTNTNLTEKPATCLRLDAMRPGAIRARHWPQRRRCQIRRSRDSTQPRGYRLTKRRGWDSNPRTRLHPVSGFQDRCVRPLRHPAGSSWIVVVEPGHAGLSSDTGMLRPSAVTTSASSSSVSTQASAASAASGWVVVMPTTSIPAARPASTPAGTSSTTRQSPGSAPSSRAAPGSSPDRVCRRACPRCTRARVGAAGRRPRARRGELPVSRGDDGPGLVGERCQERARARHRPQLLDVAGLLPVELLRLGPGVEPRSDQRDRVRGADPVHPGEEALGVQAVPLGEAPPAALDDRRRVDERAVHVEADRCERGSGHRRTLSRRLAGERGRGRRMAGPDARRCEEARTRW